MGWVSMVIHKCGTSRSLCAHPAPSKRTLHRRYASSRRWGVGSSPVMWIGWIHNVRQRGVGGVGSKVMVIHKCGAMSKQSNK